MSERYLCQDRPSRSARSRPVAVSHPCTVCPMIISPRYDGPPIMTMSGAPSDQLLPATRQRNRLNDLLGSLDNDAWSRQSRCDGWSVGDVVAHLVGATGFFEFSIKQGLANQPTRLLGGFDPATTPATYRILVLARRSMPRRSASSAGKMQRSEPLSTSASYPIRNSRDARGLHSVIGITGRVMAMP